MTSDTYPDVRALSRGLTLLEFLARCGWATPADLQAISGINRTTIYRLLGTLSKDGYVTRRDEDGAFALTPKVAAIADGVRRDDQTLVVVGRNLARLVEEVKWPSDFARLSRGRILIEGSNHRLSPMTFHRATIGQERSLLRSALGKAILSILDDEELAMLQEPSETANFVDGQTSAQSVEYIKAEIRRNGCAIAVGLVDRNVSAIAVPLRCIGQPCALNMVFFRNVIKPEEAIRRHLPALQQCAADIEAEVNQKR
jgi:IclR family mhp operon transcriptional activator